ncbi:fructose-1-phosphate kinase [Caminicella sporogenes DSM 14501]|uniref:Tagatose-6-phosphate kinase n=1 Tax=Caminicella sporogenes DSM 14501 TaxID=1121266 RepID=A0A1M6PGI8_9FIRM|nr:1-phosphofructokinase [Caminicella sporogenes]RKD21407.1 1-phosphofructokinase [Caminicella sporogenes]SHK07068.1 fructose-1-phosphate kinase [Caminicella sporogenes DSM 14501]
MIYTITFNPSIDYIVEVEDFKVGMVNRVKTNYKYPGGKGINISRVLNNFGVKNKALGFIGGFTGKYVKDFLQKEGIDTDFIMVNGDTRINVKLKSNEETEINGEGPCITEENLKELYKKIEGLTANDFLVLAGNVQKTLPRDVYSRIQERCLKNNVKVIVDTTGDVLIESLKKKPFLVKPNRQEFSEIFNKKIETKEEIIEYGEKLIKMGVQNLIISMAEEGAYLINDKGVYYASSPKGTVINSVGAGDSLIAGFLASYLQMGDLLEAFKWGVATGSATAFSLDLCKREDAISLLDQVFIKKLI